MGVYNAANALAGLIGAALGGWLVASAGYELCCTARRKVVP